MTDRRPPWRSPRSRLGGPPDRVDADVAVVGGGITGLTLTLLLAEAGVDVALFERDRLGAGVTGKSTGHLTTLPDLGLARAIDAHGEERAASVVDAMARTVDALERRAAALAPQAFERVDGYLFAEPEGDVEALRGELAAARRLGLPVTEDAPPGLPFEVEAAMRLPGQAKLSPGVWLEALAAAAREAGARLYDHAAVTRVRGKEHVELASGAEVRADRVVLATHTPVGVDPLQTEVAPHRSYVLAFRLASGAPPPALYWDTAEPYHYIRSHDGLVIAGGADHKTGHDDPAEAEARLERWVRARFDVGEIVHRWSSQVYEPIDGLPFIGESLLGRDVWVATGFSGDGLVWGTFAAQVLAAHLTGQEHPYARLLDARRVDVKAGTKDFLKENADVAKRFVADRLGALRQGDPESVGPGEGAVLRLGRKLVAVHRDASGALHQREAVCPHLGCVVSWNGVEGSWDCPCHGARYDAQGEVLEGPSTRGLKPREH